MRTLIGAFAAMLLISTAAAFAGQTEGLIKTIDKDTLTLTLEDGKSYKLNAETDLDALKPGMDIVIAYDVTNGENVVTDMELPDTE
jgi:Cu/Ag efflux protein CusF